MNTFHRVMVLMLVLGFAVAFSTAENKYVGAAKCKMCHSAAGVAGEAYKVWEKTAHAKAFEILKGKDAEEIAKKKGLKKAAFESPECLKCHVAGAGAAAEVKKEEGVSCEACHGAGSEYTKFQHGKDKEKAKTAGLMLGDKTGKACETCHNAESPTHKEFKFAEMWKKIEHAGKKK